MRQPGTVKVTRRGAVAPLTAFLLIFLVGMLAFSIDIGYVLLVQTDLQNAADAAALAGAERLQNLYVQYNIPNLTTPQQHQVLTQATTNVAPNQTTKTPGSPMYTAEQFAQYNKAGGVYITVLDSDVTFGYLDAGGNYSTTYTSFPNTISVTTRRDNSANGSLPLFFGSIFGRKNEDLTATARATIYTGDITSLQPITGLNSHILPVALDVNTWTNFYNTGNSPDGNKYNAPNGLPQLQVYPDPGNAPGQFGLLDVGPPQNNVPAFRAWIDDGETPNDIGYLLNNKLLPVSPSNPQPWKGGPGLKSTLQSDFASVMGEPNLIPLFDPVSVSPYQAASGNGSNTYYSIIGFVGVTVTQADGHGSNMNISVQPMAVIDATTVISNPTPGGTGSASVGGAPTTFISAKLTY